MPPLSFFISIGFYGLSFWWKPDFKVFSYIAAFETSILAFAIPLATRHIQNILGGEFIHSIIDDYKKKSKYIFLTYFLFANILLIVFSFLFVFPNSNEINAIQYIFIIINIIVFIFSAVFIFRFLHFTFKFSNYDFIVGIEYEKIKAINFNRAGDYISILNFLLKKSEVNIINNNIDFVKADIIAAIEPNNPNNIYGKYLSAINKKSGLKNAGQYISMMQEKFQPFENMVSVITDIMKTSIKENNQLVFDNCYSSLIKICQATYRHDIADFYGYVMPQFNNIFFDDLENKEKYEHSLGYDWYIILTYSFLSKELLPIKYLEKTNDKLLIFIIYIIKTNNVGLFKEFVSYFAESLSQDSDFVNEALLVNFNSSKDVSNEFKSKANELIFNFQDKYHDYIYYPDYKVYEEMGSALSELSEEITITLKITDESIKKEIELRKNRILSELSKRVRFRNKYYLTLNILSFCVYYKNYDLFYELLYSNSRDKDYIWLHENVVPDNFEKLNSLFFSMEYQYHNIEVGYSIRKYFDYVYLILLTIILFKNSIVVNNKQEKYCIDFNGYKYLFKTESKIATLLNEINSNSYKIDEYESLIKKCCDTDFDVKTFVIKNVAKYLNDLKDDVESKIKDIQQKADLSERITSDFKKAIFKKIKQNNAFIECIKYLNKYNYNLLSVQTLPLMLKISVPKKVFIEESVFHYSNLPDVIVDGMFENIEYQYFNIIKNNKRADVNDISNFVNLESKDEYILFPIGVNASQFIVNKYDFYYQQFPDIGVCKINNVKIPVIFYKRYDNSQSWFLLVNKSTLPILYFNQEKPEKALHIDIRPDKDNEPTDKVIIEYSMDMKIEEDKDHPIEAYYFDVEHMK